MPGDGGLSPAAAEWLRRGAWAAAGPFEEEQKAAWVASAAFAELEA